MEIGAILAALKTLLAALQPLLPLLAPVIISVLKKILPEILEKVPSAWKPILSAAIGMLIAYLTSISSGQSVTGPDMAMAFALGGGASKWRDLLTGNVEVHTGNEAVIPKDLTKSC